MAGDAQVTRWQAQLDKLFPDGAICSWERPEEADSPVTYLVGRLEVTGMAGLDPMVQGADAANGRTFGPWRVLSFTKVSPQLYRVHWDNIPEPMLWNGRVSSELAIQLAPDRRASLMRAPQGGWRTVTGEQPEGAAT